MYQRSLLATFACAVLGLAALQGCQSTGSEKVDQTSARLDAFGASIAKLQQEVLDVTSSLNQVVETAKNDPKPAFKAFSGNVDKVAASTTKARSNLDKAQSEGAKLFEAWTQRLDTITDPDIRKASEKRRDELQKVLKGVVDEASPSLTKLETFVASSKDLRTYLSQDLTPSGIKGISGKAEDLQDSGKSIHKGLDDVVKSAQKAAPHFATAKPPAAAK